VPDGIKGDALVVFARLDPSVPGETAAADHISEAVGSQLGRALRPREVHVVDTLPRTRSGKIMRRVIRAAYCKEPLGDLSSLENPEAITHIAALR
jgi:acetyl-CoA synthetase